MKKHSCGAILYTISKKKVYIILGMENGEWFPFKGTREKCENNKPDEPQGNKEISIKGVSCFSRNFKR